MSNKNNIKQIKESNIKVGGMSCAMCVNTVQKTLNNIEGISEASVNLSSESANIVYDPKLVSSEDIKKAVENSGYQFIGFEDEENIEDKEEKEKQKELRNKLIRIIIGAVTGIPLMVMMLALPHSKMLSWIMFAVSTPLFAYLGFNIFKASVKSIKNKNLDMNVMYALGMGSAYIASALSTFGILSHEFMFYETPIMLATFLSIGKYLEAKAKGRTSQAIKKLIGLKPKTANVIKEGKETQIPVDKIKIGDLVIVKPGEKIPTDGKITEGKSYVDESMITGEPVPNLKKNGDKAIGGTINKNSVLKIETQKVGEDTVLSQIIKLVRGAQNSKPPIQNLADKVVTIFIPVVLSIALGVFLLWLLIMNETMLFSFSRLISILVIACPCALGLATPTALTVGLGKGAELGILIKNSEALEVSEKLNTIIFDKTGTLTKGKPEVTNIVAYEHDENELLFYSSSLEKNSQHPLGEAIINKAKEQNINPSKAYDFDTYEGKGISGRVKKDDSDEGKEVIIGNRGLIKERGINITQEIENTMKQLENDGKTAMIIIIDNKISGIIAVADPIKETTSDAVKLFKEAGLDVIMITGDNERTAKAIGRRIGIDKVIAEVLPEDKAKEVKRLQESGQIVAFTGDGINDAPALAQSDVGIAIGSGTDVAMESGDIVLMKDNLVDAFYSLQLSKKVMRRIKQNLFWAFAYNSLLIPIAGGALSSIGFTLKPEFAGLAMAMSSVTVVTLSLLLKRFNPKRGNKPSST